MKIRIRKVIGFQDLVMLAGWFCVISYALLEHVSIAIPLFSVVKMPILFLGAFSAVFQINVFLKNMLKKRYFYALVVLFMMLVFLMLSMLRNQNILPAAYITRSTLRLVLFLLELFVLTIVIIERGYSKAAIRLVFFYVLILVLLSDALMFSGVVRFRSGRHENYIIGTKFTVVYMHLNLLALWLVQYVVKNVRRRSTKWKILGAAVVLVAIALRVDCMSGVLGSFFLTMLLVWMNLDDRMVSTLASPMIVVMAILASTLFAFVAGNILKIPFVSDFIVDVLGRSATLTGRLGAYSKFNDTMQGNWLLGYGYGSAYLMSIRFLGCADTQNAILQWILQSGVLTSTMLVVLIAVVFRQIKEYGIEINDKIKPLIALLYTYIMLGTVEIVYSLSFFLWIALIFMSVNNQIVARNRES